MADLTILDDGVHVVVTLVTLNGAPYDITAITDVTFNLRISAEEAIQIVGEKLTPFTDGRVRATLLLAHLPIAGPLYLAVSITSGPALVLNTTEVLQLQVRELL